MAMRPRFQPMMADASSMLQRPHVQRTWPELSARLQEMLDAIAGGLTSPAEIADELEGLAPELRHVGAPKAVRRAVADLVNGLRSGTGIEATVDRLRDALAGKDRKVGRFWG